MISLPTASRFFYPIKLCTSDFNPKLYELSFLRVCVFRLMRILLVSNIGLAAPKKFVCL